MIGKISAAVFARIAYVRLASLLETAGAPLPVKIVIYVLCFASVVLFCMWKWQESLLYMPAVPNPQAPMGAKLHKLAQNPPGLRSPAEQDLRYEDVTLTASDGVKLSAWFIPAGNPAAPTIIFAHENAGNMGLRLQEFKVLHDHVGCHVLCYDYRGYGDSDEAPINEEGLMADALAAWRWLAEKDEPRVDRSRIFLYGRSLGGAVTIQLARLLCEEAAASAGGASSALLPAGVLVGNTFTSISEMLGSVYPFLNFGLIRRHLLRLQWRSIEHIRHVRVPISFMVGTDDELVPPAHTEVKTGLTYLPAYLPLTYLLELLTYGPRARVSCAYRGEA